MTKPLRVSWSSLRTFEECAQKSALVREGKRSKITNTRNFYPGTVVDHIMRIWLDLPANIVRPPMAGFVDEIMDRSRDEEKERGNIVRFRNAEDRDEVRKFCTELVTRLEPILYKHVLPYSYRHGFWFKVPLSIPDQHGLPREILLTGEMDLIVDNDGPVVWDLKGTADNQYWRKVIAQLTFYDLAVWISTKVKTRHVGLIQPMCDERVLALEVTDADRSNLMLRIQRYAHGVWADERTCTDDTGICHWCDVRHACSKFQKPNLDAFGGLADAFRTAAAGEPT
jgi:hypothetical protein